MGYTIEFEGKSKLPIYGRYTIITGIKKKKKKKKKKPTPVPTPTPNPTKSPTPKPTKSPTPKPTKSPTPEPTKSPTPEPTDTPKPKPTDTPKPKPTGPKPTDTPKPKPPGPKPPGPKPPGPKPPGPKPPGPKPPGPKPPGPKPPGPKPPGPKPPGPKPSGKFDPDNPKKGDTTEDSFTYEPEPAPEVGPNWKKVRNRVFWVNDGTWDVAPANKVDHADCLGLECTFNYSNIVGNGAHAFSIATTDMGDVRIASYGEKENGFNVSLKNGNVNLTYMNLNPGYDEGTADGPEFCQPYCTKKCCPEHGDYNNPFSDQGLGNASCFTPVGGDAQNGDRHGDNPEDGGQDPYPNLHPCIDNRYPECNKEMNNYNCFWPKAGQFFYYDSSILTKEDLTKRGFKFGK